MLLVNPYAASGGQQALTGFTIPADTVEGRIIVSFHAYEPYNFALNTSNEYNTWSESNFSDKNSINAPIDRYYARFVLNGYPVLIGEFGAMNKNNLESRTAWAKYYTEYAMSRGMPCFWWDNASFTGNGEKFGLLNRANNTFTYPDIVNALREGAGVKINE